MKVPSTLASLAVPAACFVAGYVAHYILNRKPRASSRYHLDPTLACLTKHQSPITQTSTWINLGLWTSDDLSFPAACEQLALRLGQAARLSALDSVLDVGCGRGDQCVLWHDHFKVAQTAGIDITLEHVASAKLLVEQRHLSSSIEIHHASVADLLTLDVIKTKNVTKILSCDAAYHFTTRMDFFANAFALLQAGGMLALIDIVVSEEVLSWKGLDHIQLRGLCSMASIPFENLRTPAQYQADLESAGFVNVQIEALHEVASGFASFVARQSHQLGEWSLGADFEKFEMVGAVLAACAQHKYMHFVVATGEKPM
ncbi:hypothetical protein LEN26_005940 [Aphanomyces euteiches]|nr:hypothetical protein LEN26_005940 [Aphanomyces euteiches]